MALFVNRRRFHRAPVEDCIAHHTFSRSQQSIDGAYRYQYSTSKFSVLIVRDWAVRIYSSTVHNCGHNWIKLLQNDPGIWDRISSCTAWAVVRPVSSRRTIASIMSSKAVNSHKGEDSLTRRAGICLAG